MVLAAYLDESGANNADPALIMSGFISEESLWAEFSEKWQLALHDWGIDHFHMVDFEARRKQFQEWPRDKESEARLGHLLGLITKYSMGLVSVAFPRQLMKTVFISEPKQEERIYLMTAATTLLHIIQFPKELLPGNQVDVVFEAGAKGRHQVEQAWNSLPSETRRGVNLRSLTFAPKRSLLPLQAADILAYEEFRQFPKNWGRATRPPRYPLRVLKGAIRVQGGGVVTPGFLTAIWSSFTE